MRVSILQVIHRDSGLDVRSLGAVLIDREVGMPMRGAKTGDEGHEERRGGER
jgi:hypothetical protein